MEKIKVSSFLKAAKRADEIFSEVCVEYGEGIALRNFFKDGMCEINDEFPFEYIKCLDKENEETSYTFKRKTDDKYFELSTHSNQVEAEFLFEKEAPKAVNM